MSLICRVLTAKNKLASSGGFRTPPYQSPILVFVCSNFDFWNTFNTAPQVLCLKGDVPSLIFQIFVKMKYHSRSVAVSAELAPRIKKEQRREINYTAVTPLWNKALKNKNNRRYDKSLNAGSWLQEKITHSEVKRYSIFSVVIDKI